MVQISILNLFILNRFPKKYPVVLDWNVPELYSLRPKKNATTGCVPVKVFNV